MEKIGKSGSGEIESENDCVEGVKKQLSSTRSGSEKKERREEEKRRSFDGYIFIFLSLQRLTTFTAIPMTTRPTTDEPDWET